MQLGVVWLTGFNLRVILFAIAPSLPAIRSELGLSFSATGSITSVAVLILGLASIPGALLATRYGARRLVSVCGIGLTMFTFSLTLPPAVFWVFAGTALLTLSISLAQPPLAVLIRRWFPDAIARAGNLYGNGLLMGSVLGGSLSPYLSGAIGWRGTFLVWAAVAGIGVLLWTRFTPRDSTAAPQINLGAIAQRPAGLAGGSAVHIPEPRLLHGRHLAAVRGQGPRYRLPRDDPTLPEPLPHPPALGPRSFPLAVRALDRLLRHRRTPRRGRLVRACAWPDPVRLAVGFHGRARSGRGFRRVRRPAAPAGEQRKRGGRILSRHVHRRLHAGIRRTCFRRRAGRQHRACCDGLLAARGRWDSDGRGGVSGASPFGQVTGRGLVVSSSPRLTCGPAAPSSSSYRSARPPRPRRCGAP